MSVLLNYNESLLKSLYSRLECCTYDPTKYPQQNVLPRQKGVLKLDKKCTTSLSLS